MNLKKFFSELKRRNIYKVAITYAITAWLLAQIVALASDTFEAPDWVMRMIFITLIIGFPIALIMAWAFEMSPQGIIKTSSIAADKNPYASGKKKPFTSNLFIGILIIIVIGQFVYSNFWIKNETDFSTVDNNSAIEKSIAVLPFVNMSGDPDNEPFCLGMTGAVISRLIKIKGIGKITSETSIRNYNQKGKTTPEIAKDLKVTHILAAGFQKSGNDIKINLQLIDGKLDSIFWSEEYIGKYDSIFKIQAEVAELVAEQLDANITKEELVDIMKTMTANTQAYEYYLRGEYLISNWSMNNIIASRKYYEKAIELDSLFVEAYVSLGETYSSLGAWVGNLSYEEANRLGSPYLEKALELDPDNHRVLLSLAWNEFFDWNFNTADSLYQELRNRGNRPVWDYHINLMLGRYDEVIKNGNALLREDQYLSTLHWTLAYAYYYKGQVDSTISIMRDALRQYPKQVFYYDHFGNIYIELKDYQKAKNLLETGLEISEKRHASMVVHLAIVYHYLGDEEKSLKYLNEVIARANSGEPEINVFLSHYYSRMGNLNEAFKWLDKAFEKHEVDLIWLKAEPNLANLRDDPRYKALCVKVGFP